MNKKYIIEKRDLALLPSSYIGLGNKYSSNYEKINNALNQINDAEKLIKRLKITVDNLSNDNISLYKQLRFIKKNYVPRIYINIYTKNNRPIKYINLIIKFFDFSKTIYLGRYSKIHLFLSEINPNISIRNLKTTLYNYLRPIVLDKCSSIRNKSEFIELKLSSKNLFDKRSIDIKKSDPESFSTYLKQFE